jgi:hypothetical protein
MFCGMYLNGLRASECCADRISTNIGFRPTATALEMNLLTCINGPVVALSLDDNSRRVRQDHHGVGVAQEAAALFQSRRRAPGEPKVI